MTRVRKGSCELILGCLILIINLSVATVYYPKTSDYGVNSEGLWRNDIDLKPETKLSEGASRFDVSGVLTNVGTRQGASMFAMIVFPLLIPIIMLVGGVMLFMSVVGTNGFAAVGRRSDLIGNSLGSGGLYYGLDITPPGYKLDGDGFLPVSLTNREGFAFDPQENDTCLERLACELVLHGGPKIIGKKATLALLRELHVRPIISPTSPGKKARKVWKCSRFKCNWERWLPWKDKDALKGS